MLDLKDKVVIITGGTRGIGYETAKAFCENGAKVVLLGSKIDTVNTAVENLKQAGYKVKGYYPKLTDFDEVKEIADKVQQEYGRIDVLINNAGKSANQKIEETSAQDFAEIMDLNVDAIFNMCKAVVPYMKKQGGGVIINTSSMVSFCGQPSGVGYPASKAAVNGLTKSLARELAPFNIRVNAVAPGIIKTDMVANLPDEVIEPLIKTIPLGRIGSSRDVANAFLFLASDKASYITGDILQVDGGAKN